MYTQPCSAPLGMRDVIAAWLVCFAVFGTVFVYSGVSSEPERKAHAAVKKPALSELRIGLCPADGERAAALRG